MIIDLRIRSLLGQVIAVHTGGIIIISGGCISFPQVQIAVHSTLTFGFFQCQIGFLIISQVIINTTAVIGIQLFVGIQYILQILLPDFPVSVVCQGFVDLDQPVIIFRIHRDRLVEICLGTLVISQFQFRRSPQEIGVLLLRLQSQNGIIYLFCLRRLSVLPVGGCEIIVHIVVYILHPAVTKLQRLCKILHCLIIFCQPHAGNPPASCNKTAVLLLCFRFVKGCQCTLIIQCFHQLHPFSDFRSIISAACQHAYHQTTDSCHHYFLMCFTHAFLHGLFRSLLLYYFTARPVWMCNEDIS